MLGAILGHMYNWLALGDAVGQADLVFALAGRQSRKLFALELLAKKFASTVLVSVGRFEIRRFRSLPWPEPIDLVQIAAPVPPPQRHFFVLLESGKTTVERVHEGKLGTLSEICALASWLRQRPAISSVLLVTSGFHLRRVRMCCRVIMPENLELRFVAVPDEGPSLNRLAWWADPGSRGVVVREYFKLAVYSLVLLSYRLYRLSYWLAVGNPATCQTR